MLNYSFLYSSLAIMYRNKDIKGYENACIVSGHYKILLKGCSKPF